MLVNAAYCHYAVRGDLAVFYHFPPTTNCLRPETCDSSPGVDEEERLQSLESERARRRGEEKGLKKNLGYSLLKLILCKSLTAIALVEKVKTSLPWQRYPCRSQLLCLPFFLLN